MSCRTGLVRSTVSFHAVGTEPHLTPGYFRVKEKLRSGEMLVRGDQWPLFLYADTAYDPEDPWNGLLRSHLLVAVCTSRQCICFYRYLTSIIQGFKHVFTSPSSVDEDEPKATRSGNARMHGMKSVTKASLAYIATQASTFLFSRDAVGYVFSGSLRTLFFEHFFPGRSHYRLGDLLFESPGLAR